LGEKLGKTQQLIEVDNQSHVSLSFSYNLIGIPSIPEFHLDRCLSCFSPFPESVVQSVSSLNGSRFVGEKKKKNATMEKITRELFLKKQQVIRNITTKGFIDVQ
jgi:hypothetical protein